MSVAKVVNPGGVRRAQRTLMSGPDPAASPSAEAAPEAQGLKRGTVLPLAVPKSKPRNAGRPLSEKELEVLKWARAGKTVWEISRIREISQATVKFHLRNIYLKLGVANRAHAVGEALRRGLLQ